MKGDQDGTGRRDKQAPGSNDCLRMRRGATAKAAPAERW